MTVVISKELAEYQIDNINELIALNNPHQGYKKYDDYMAALREEKRQLKEAIKKAEVK